MDLFVQFQKMQQLSLGDGLLGSDANVDQCALDPPVGERNFLKQAEVEVYVGHGGPPRGGHDLDTLVRVRSRKMLGHGAQLDPG